MKKIVSKILYKIGAVFFKIHQFFFNAGSRFALDNLSISDRNKKKWYTDNVEKKLRYEYDLSENSVVFDVGGYEGDFASEISARYKANIYVFEPVSIYITQLNERFKKNNSIHIIPAGLGAKSEEISISIMDEASSHTRDTYMNKQGTVEIAKIVDISEFIQQNKIEKVDLLKINIEGAEYELLERIIELKSLSNFKNLQIQFHDFYPNFQERYNSIRQELEKTHKLTYEYSFVWENWELKKKE
jgi:FkbM family methyltransferase